MEIIHKNIGETTLEALKRFRASSRQHEERLSYAGRLDPMASGKLLILEGEENDSRSEFLGLDKTYEFTILFGVSTDSFDLLGFPEEIVADFSALTIDEINEILQSFLGSWEMTYPPYSAKNVAVDNKKVPLWQLARSGHLPEKLPTKNVEVYEASCKSIEEMTSQEILKYVHTHIPLVSGDFRQREVIARWEDVLKDQDQFYLAHCRAAGSSGLYVRRLAKEVGVRLNVPALAFSITRIQIGKST